MPTVFDKAVLRYNCRVGYLEQVPFVPQNLNLYLPALYRKTKLISCLSLQSFLLQSRVGGVCL